MGTWDLGNALDTERFRQVETTVPALLGHGTVLARVPGCAAWITDVRVHATGVSFRISMIARPSLLPEDEGLLDLWDEDADGDAAIRTRAWLDGAELTRLTSRTPPTDRLFLEHVEGGGSPTQVELSWWIPVVPHASLRVEHSWPRAGLHGVVDLDASDWPRLAAGVTTI